MAPSLDAEANVLKFRNSHKAEYPMLSDARNMARRYLVRSYPFMYLVGKDSKIIWKGNFHNKEMVQLLEKALAAEGPAKKKVPTSVYVLNDGRRLSVVSKMKAGENFILRTTDGKMITVDGKDIKEVLKGQDATAGEAAKKTGEKGTAAQDQGAKSKYPIMVLRDGRRIPVTMKMSTGESVMVKDDLGRMHTIKKRDIVETIPAGK